MDCTDSKFGDAEWIDSQDTDAAIDASSNVSSAKNGIELPNTLRGFIRHFLKARKRTMENLLKNPEKKRVNLPRMLKHPLEATMDDVRRLISTLHLVSPKHVDALIELLHEEKKKVLRKKHMNMLGMDISLFVSDYPDVLREDSGMRRLMSHRTKLGQEELCSFLDRAMRGNPYPFPDMSPLRNWELIRTFVTTFDETETSGRYNHVVRRQKKRELMIGNAWLRAYISQSYEKGIIDAAAIGGDKVIRSFMQLGMEYAQEIDPGFTRSYPTASGRSIAEAIQARHNIADAIDQKCSELWERDNALSDGYQRVYRDHGGN